MLHRGTQEGSEHCAAFSDFATQQNQELYVNIEGCDFSNMDLSGEVLSGVKARGANFRNSIFGPECSRADFSVADLRGAVIRNVNLYNTVFAGANLEGADFTASLASGAFFGKDEQTGELANLKGAVFEDTLLSSSDVTRPCQQDPRLRGEDEPRVLTKLRDRADHPGERRGSRNARHVVIVEALCRLTEGE